MGQYFDLVKKQKTHFDSHMDPTKVVQNLILLVSSPDPYFSASARVSSLKMLEFLCELDSHPEFRYQDERKNPYFDVVVRHFQDYVSIANKFAEFYSPSSLERFFAAKTQEQEQAASRQSTSGMQVDEVANQATSPQQQ